LAVVPAFRCPPTLVRLGRLLVTQLVAIVGNLASAWLLPVDRGAALDAACSQIRGAADLMALRVLLAGLLVSQEVQFLAHDESSKSKVDSPLRSPRELGSRLRLSD
jgi:hypothetical protein